MTDSLLPASPATFQPASGGRLVWVDVAKAMAIVLVVLHHSLLYASAAGWVPGRVLILDSALAALPIPLFFLASGIFAAQALSRPWREVLQRRILPYAWLYAVWTLVRFVFFTVVPNVRGSAKDADLSALLASPVLPVTGLWFIYALAVFSVLAKLALRIPASWQLLVAAGLAVVAPAGLLPIDSWVWRGMAGYLFFFLAGMHAPTLVRSLADRATLALLLVLGTTCAVVLAGVSLTGAGRLPGVLLVESCLAVASAVVLAAVLARSEVGMPLTWLGSRTLPVYVLHVMWVAGLVATAVAAGLSPSRWTGCLAVLVVASAATACSLVSYRWARRYAPFLFVPPWWRANGAGASLGAPGATAPSS